MMNEGLAGDNRRYRGSPVSDSIAGDERVVVVAVVVAPRWARTSADRPEVRFLSSWNWDEFSHSGLSSPIPDPSGNHRVR